MSEKTVKAIISNSGKIYFDYNGYEGNECFEQADKIKAKLASIGIKSHTVFVDPKKTETETVQLENPIKAGHG